MPEEKQIKMVCGECGSDDVRRDAWACWNIISQCWVLHSTYDHSYCENCDGECSLIEKEIG